MMTTLIEIGIDDYGDDLRFRMGGEVIYVPPLSLLPP